MINYVYQLIEPKVIAADYRDLPYGENVILRPEYMSICRADQRYYFGMREPEVLAEKLPMALIHECCARVVFDPTGTFRPDEKVIPVPNVPTEPDNGIYENYRTGSYFLSSGHDGFMQEFVSLPADRLVRYQGIEPKIAAITEYVSVAAHAIGRMEAAAHEHRERIGVWGDGSLAFVTANVLKRKFPERTVAVIGHNRQKLPMFSFADETYYCDRLPEDFRVDHAFECVGGESSEKAVDEIIAHIRPQGSVMLMGVSENPVEVLTRMVLEKGLSMIGCSRSGIADFKEAVRLLGDEALQSRLAAIITEDEPVRSIADIHRVFGNDRNNLFKTVFKWEL